jgi:large subunit ribosomal protein L20
MPRVKNGVARLRKKRRLMRRVKGFYGNRSKLLRQAKETLLRGQVFATKHRRRKKGTMRRLWTVRINAACRSRGITYGRFIQGLKKAGVILDRKLISDMAIRDVAGFEKLVAMARTAG